VYQTGLDAVTVLAARRIAQMNAARRVREAEQGCGGIEPATASPMRPVSPHQP